MKKKIYIISVLIFICTLSHNIYAEEAKIEGNQILSLTLDEAIRLAQKNNTDIIDIEIKIEKSKKSRDKYIELQEEYDKLLNMSFEELDEAGIYNITENYAEKMLHQSGYYVNLERQTINALKNEKLQLLTKIKIDTKVQYFKIVLLEKNLGLYLLNLERNTYKKNHTKISYEHNFATEVDMINAELEVLYANDKLDSSIHSLEIEKASFLQSIGVDTKNEYILKDKDLSYIPLDNIVLEDSIASALEKRPEILAKVDEIKSIEQYKRIMTSYYGEYSDIGQIEIKRYNNSKLELSNLKNSIQSYISNTYLALKQCEIALKNNFKREEILNKESKRIDILYEHGQASIIDVINIKSDLLTDKIKNYSLLTEYLINRDIFENIDILSYTIK